jgi:hypothetical protein
MNERIKSKAVMAAAVAASFFAAQAFAQLAPQDQASKGEIGHSVVGESQPAAEAASQSPVQAQVRLSEGELKVLDEAAPKVNGRSAQVQNEKTSERGSIARLNGGYSTRVIVAPAPKPGFTAVEYEMQVDKDGVAQVSSSLLKQARCPQHACTVRQENKEATAAQIVGAFMDFWQSAKLQHCPPGARCIAPMMIPRPVQPQ